MNNTNNDIVAIYCRLSKEDDNAGESESIQNQKSMLIAYALSNKWDIYNIYVDDDYSGTDNSRPKFNSMLKDAKKGNFNIILCKTQSRFSRDMAVIENYLHGKFIEWGIRFISIVDNADTNNKGNKKARQINSLINEWYIEDLSENIRAVLQNKMRKGEYLATYAPYGYKKDTNQKNHLIIDNEAAVIVRMIYNWHLEGYGAQKIARMLNEKNIPNPRKYKEILSIRKTKMYATDEQGLWNTTTIGDILHNQTYCGDTVQNTQKKASYKSEKRIRLPKSEWIIVENTHSPIIDRKIFEQVQRNLSSKKRASGTGEVHILSGKVICYNCKRVMQKNNGYLRCRNKYTIPSKDKCVTQNIKIDLIEQTIKNELSKLTDDYLKSKRQINHHYSTNKTTETKIKNLKTEIKKRNEIIKTLYIDKVSGLITEKQFKDFNKDFLESKQELQKELYNLKISLNINNKEFTNETLKSFMKSNDFIRNIICNLVEYIEIGRIDKETGKQILSIHWSF